MDNLKFFKYKCLLHVKYLRNVFLHIYLFWINTSKHLFFFRKFIILLKQQKYPAVFRNDAIYKSLNHLKRVIKQHFIVSLNQKFWATMRLNIFTSDRLIWLFYELAWSSSIPIFIDFVVEYQHPFSWRRTYSRW